MSNFETLTEPITELYREMREGNKAAENHLLEAIYQVLLNRARAFGTKFPAGDTGTAHGLLHEAYVRLSSSLPNVENRQHLLWLMTQAMRQITLDRIRKAMAQKRWGESVTFSTTAELRGHGKVAKFTLADKLELSEGLDLLAKQNPEAVELLDLSFFMGRKPAEIAKQLEITPGEVGKRLRRAQAELAKILASKSRP